MRQALRGDNELQRSTAGENEIERAVLVIAGKQTVEGKQARQQCREPKNRGADAFEKREIRPDSKRRQGDDDKKEQHAHSAPPPTRTAMRMSRKSSALSGFMSVALDAAREDRGEGDLFGRAIVRRRCTGRRRDRARYVSPLE